MDLKEIKDPSFLQGLSIKELEELSEEIRNFIIDAVSKRGGHLSSNLGIVELTIALHRYFHNGEKFIFDVGHQSYTHKILTGRAKDFDKLRKKDGLAGFQSRSESEEDIWEVAHSSTSLAAQAGFLLGNIKAISIIGDGALTGGEAFEALNFLATLNKNAIIILNDNNYSISKNVGFIKHSLDKLRSTRGYIKLADKNRRNYPLKSIKNTIKSVFYRPSIFDDMGFKYYGPIDGHNFKELFKYFSYAERQNRPVIIHVVTKKGKGYTPAETDTIGAWHSTSPFDKSTGKRVQAPDNKEYFSEALSKYLTKFYDEHPRDFKVVMPAMTYSSNMVSLRDHMGKDYIDTGIAEQFATSLSSALALSGYYVCLPIYSSFLQRSYDQLFQDIAMQNAHVVVLVDKAGLISDNGKTHQGLYDISYLRTIPNLTVLAPKDAKELYEMLDYSFLNLTGPVCIHLPNELVDKTDIPENLKFNPSWDKVNDIVNPKANLITYSSSVNYLKDALKSMNIEIINAKTISPLDEECLIDLSKTNNPLFIYEEAPGETSLTASILSFFNRKNIAKQIASFSYPLDFIRIGTKEQLRKEYRMDIESIKQRILELL